MAFHVAFRMNRNNAPDVTRWNERIALVPRAPAFDPRPVLIIRGGPGEMEAMEEGGNLARTIPTSNPDHGSNKLNQKEK